MERLRTAAGLTPSVADYRATSPRATDGAEAMSFFTYDAAGDMQAEGVALETIAQQVGTPFYCYSAGALRAAWQEFASAMKGMNASVCYALKANSNLAVVKLFGDLGAGADIVSVGEMKRALAAGIPAKQDRLLRRRQEADRADGRAAGRHRPDQCRELGRARDAERRRGPARRARPRSPSA